MTMLQAIAVVGMSFLVLVASDCLAGVTSVVPLPVKIEGAAGAFTLNDRTAIVAASDLRETTDLVAADLRAATGLPLPVTAEKAASTIRLRLDPSLADLAAEGYRLTIAPEFAEIIAPTPAGLFYGSRTLLQLLPPPGSAPRIECQTIEDHPRFGWRGLMLDCSRTFQSIDYLQKTIDRMSYYKMNVLHLHLTDDQGWRLEIRKYPKLTAQGARFADKYHEPPENQGFYTREQMIALVAYARLRHVEIVPEIEMPGHSVAALACYPNLSCSGEVPEVFPFFKGPNITTQIYCAGNDETFDFLENVLAEVVEIFPSRFVHIGGDEVPKVAWKNCPKCQARMKAEGLKSEAELQAYFIRRVQTMLSKHGKRLIGWDEIMEGGLAPGAAVMNWRGNHSAAKAGNDVVMSPTSHCYFDYSYKSISTQRAYAYEPVPPDLTPEQSRHILGVQANFWSHIDRKPELVDRQLFPRLLAIAERGWSPRECRDWNAFKPRLDTQLPQLARMGIQYRPDPVGQWSKAKITETYQPLEFDVSDLVLSPGTYRATLKYTGGQHRLGMESAELLANGQPIATDRHRGTTGATDDQNTYDLKVDRITPNTRYTLRLSARSEGGTDSSGEVYFVRQ